MESSVLGNALSFIVALVILTGFAAIIGIAFYHLILRDRETNTSAIQVKQGNQELDGVPFFIKQSRWLHETTYLETLINCSIAATGITLDDQGKQLSAKNLDAASRITPWSEQAAETLLMIQKNLALAQDETDPDGKWALWSDNIRPSFESLPVYDGKPPTDAVLPVISNVVREEVYVDYETPHTINYPQPLVGSANVSVELSAEGTLGKTSAEIKDDTFSSLLGALPIQDVVSSTLAVKKPAPAAEEVADAPMAAIGEKALPVVKTYRFSLTCSQRYVRHICYKQAGSTAPTKPIPLAEADAGSCWYRQEFVADLAPPEKSDKAADKKETEKKNSGGT